MLREEVLNNTLQVLEERKSRNAGQGENSFTLISELWSAYLNHHIDPDEVAMMMVLLKVARSKLQAYNPDNYVDAAGYSAIAGELRADLEDYINHIAELLI